MGAHWVTFRPRQNWASQLTFPTHWFWIIADSLAITGADSLCPAQSKFPLFTEGPSATPGIKNPTLVPEVGSKGLVFMALTWGSHFEFALFFSTVKVA